MRNKRFIFLLIADLLLTSFAFAQSAGQTTTISRELIVLPAPATSGGPALTQALAERRSVRSFSAMPLTLPHISQLLWAAQGVTDDEGHRTAPSAMARYFLTLYVAKADGLFQYIPTGHKLRRLSSTDVRAKLSSQESVGLAPVVFIVAGDYERAVKSTNLDSGTRYVDLEAGHATQNLLLQAAALGLGAVPVGGINRDVVAKVAGLPDSSRPIYLVPVGHSAP